MPRAFSFQHQLTLSEDQYVSIWRSAKSSRRWRMLASSSASAVAIGALSFLSKYTIALGLAIACFFLFLGILGFLPPPMLRKTYRGFSYLKHPVTYSLDKKGISVEGNGIQAKAAWQHLSTWQITGDWLVLKFKCTPTAFFPVDQLKEAGIFEPVMSLAKQSAPEFT